jgi:hypothetical protein
VVAHTLGRGMASLGRGTRLGKTPVVALFSRDQLAADDLHALYAAHQNLVGRATPFGAFPVGLARNPANTSRGRRAVVPRDQRPEETHTLACGYIHLTRLVKASMPVARDFAEVGMSFGATLGATLGSRTGGVMVTSQLETLDLVVPCDAACGCYTQPVLRLEVVHTFQRELVEAPHLVVLWPTHTLALSTVFCLCVHGDAPSSRNFHGGNGAVQCLLH